VVTSAFRGQIALTGRTVWIGDSVVEVAENSLGTAGRSSAGGSPSANKMLEPSAGGVVVLGVRVVAPSLNDGAEGDVQAADQVGQLLGLVGVGATGGLWTAATTGDSGRRGFLPWGAP
jgi:hypothetical protein